MPEDIRLSVGGDVRPLSKEIDKVRKKGLNLNTKGIGNFKNPLGKITGQLGEFEKSLEASNARVLAFGASAGALVAVQQGLKAIVSEAINVEKSLADINVILNVSSSSLQKFSQDLFSVAKNTGQSFQEVATAATELSRQGLSVEETLKRTQDALILTRLSGLKAAESVQAVTAALNSFSRAALDSSEFVSKLAAVDAAFAVDSGDLAKAIQRVGSSAQDAGVSLDQLIAIVTSAQQITARGGAVIGNSFKTIFTRIQRPRVLKELENLGIGVSDLSGNTRPAIQILTELAKTFDTLGSAQRAQIAELVGGVFQVNVLKASLRDLGKEFSLYNNALGISATATDEAARRNEELNKTIAATLNQTVQNFKQFGAQAGQLTFGPAISNVLGGINSALEGFDLKQAESTGEKVASGVLSGIGRFLAGPGLIVGAVTLVKTFSRLGQQVTDAFKTISGLGGASAEQLKIQQKVNQVLGANPQILDAIESGTLDIAEAHRLILTGINKETAAYQKQAGIVKQLSGLLRAANVGVSETLGGGTVLSTTPINKSRGHIPNFANREKVMKAMELNSASYTNSSTRAIKDNISGVGPIIRNSKEDKVNVPGLKQPFINPPRSSSEGKLHRANSIKQTGIDPYLLSGGFVPNFAKGMKLNFKPAGGGPEDKTWGHLSGIFSSMGKSSKAQAAAGLDPKLPPNESADLRDRLKANIRVFEADKTYTQIQSMMDKAGVPKKAKDRANLFETLMNKSVGGRDVSAYASPVDGIVSKTIANEAKLFGSLPSGGKHDMTKKDYFLGKMARYAYGVNNLLSGVKKDRKVGSKNIGTLNLGVPEGVGKSLKSKGLIPNFADEMEVEQIKEIIKNVPTKVLTGAALSEPKGFPRGKSKKRLDTTIFGLSKGASDTLRAGYVKGYENMVDRLANDVFSPNYDPSKFNFVFDEVQFPQVKGSLFQDIIGGLAGTSGGGKGQAVDLNTGVRRIFERHNKFGIEKKFTPGLFEALDQPTELKESLSAAGVGKTGSEAENYIRAGIDRVSEQRGTPKLSKKEADKVEKQVNQFIDSSMARGFIPNFATGIFDSDKIKGDRKLKTGILNQILDSGKPIHTFHGAAGTGKTTMASKRFGRNFVLSAADIQKYSDFAVISGAGRSRKTGNISAQTQKIFDKSSNISAVVPTNQEIINRRFNRLDEAKASGSPDTRGISGLKGTLKAPLNDFGIYSDLRKQGKNVELLRNAGFIPSFFSETAKAKSRARAGVVMDLIDTFNPASFLGAKDKLKQKTVIERNQEFLKSKKVRPKIEKLLRFVGEDANAEDRMQLKNYRKVGRGDFGHLKVSPTGLLQFGLGGKEQNHLMDPNRVLPTSAKVPINYFPKGGLGRVGVKENIWGKVVEANTRKKGLLKSPQAHRGVIGRALVEHYAKLKEGGLNFANGFVPNFNEVLGYGKGSLGEAINREMSATGNSRNQIGIDSNSALRSSQNPMGLGVFDKKRETSLEHGMQLARAAGINPKTKGKSSGHIPNFAEEEFSGKSSLLQSGIKIKGKGSGKKFKELAATLEKVNAAYTAGLPEAKELEQEAGQLAKGMNLSDDGLKKFNGALKESAAGGKNTRGMFKSLGDSFIRPSAAMQGLETRLLSASFAIPVVTDTIKQFGGELSQTTDGLINSISGGISTFSGIASILPGPAGIAAAGLAGAGAAAGGIAKALQATSAPLKAAAEQSKEDFTKLSNNLTGYAQAFGEFQAAAADTKTTAQTLLRLKDKLNSLLESVPDEFRLELAGLQKPEEIQSRIAEILNKEAKTDMQRQISANLAVDLDEASGIVSGLVELFGGASKEFRKIFDGAKGEIQASRLVADIRKGLEFKDLAQDLGDARKATRLQNASQNELINILGKQFGATAALQLQLRELSGSDFNKFRRGLIESANAARRAAEATDKLRRKQEEVSTNLGIGDQQAGIGILQMNVDFEAEAMKTIAGGIEAFLDPSKLKEPIDALSAAIKQAAQLGNFGTQTTASGRIARGRAELGIGKGLVEFLGGKRELDPKTGLINDDSAVGKILRNVAQANEERIRTQLGQQRQQFINAQQNVVASGKAPDETFAAAIKEITQLLSPEGKGFIQQAARQQAAEGLNVKEAPRTAVNLQTAAGTENITTLGAAIRSRGGEGPKALGNAFDNLTQQLKTAKKAEEDRLARLKENNRDTTKSEAALTAINTQIANLATANTSGNLANFDITQLTGLKSGGGDRLITEARFGLGQQETPAQKVLREAQDKLRNSQDLLREEITALTNAITKEEKERQKNEAQTELKGVEAGLKDTADKGAANASILRENLLARGGGKFLDLFGGDRSGDTEDLRTQIAGRVQGNVAREAIAEVIDEIGLQEVRGDGFLGRITGDALQDVLRLGGVQKETFGSKFLDTQGGSQSSIEAVNILKNLLDKEKITDSDDQDKIDKLIKRTNFANLQFSEAANNFTKEQKKSTKILVENLLKLSDRSDIKPLINLLIQANQRPGSVVGNANDKNLGKAWKAETDGIRRSFGAGSGVEPVLRKGPGGKYVVANTAEANIPFNELLKVAEGGSLNVRGNAVGASMAVRGIKATESLGGLLSRSIKKLSKATGEFANNIKKSGKNISSAADNLKVEKNIFGQTTKVSGGGVFPKPVTMAETMRRVKEADNIAAGRSVSVGGGKFAPGDPSKVNPLVAQDNAQGVRRIASAVPDEFGAVKQLAPGQRNMDAANRVAASKATPMQPKDMIKVVDEAELPRQLQSNKGPSRVGNFLRNNPKIDKLAGKAFENLDKAAKGLGKAAGPLALLIEPVVARAQFDSDDPEKFIDSRVDSFRSPLNSALAGFDPTTLVTIFGSQMQRQNDKLQARQDQENADIRRRTSEQRAGRKAGESIMGSSSRELVADLVKRINRDGFSGSRAIQSGFRNESEEIMHRGDGAPFSGFQKGLEMLRGDMTLSLMRINSAGAKGLTARRTSDSLDGKESVKVSKLLQLQLHDLGQAVPAQGVTLEGRQLENLKETLDRLALNAETEKEAIAEKEFIRLENQLKRTNAIFETNFDLSQLTVEKETGQVLNPLQFFQRSGNADNFRNIAATALENEKANKLRSQFNPELIRQRQEEFKGSDLGAAANRIQAVADSAGKALGGAMQNTVTRVLDNFTKLGGQPGLEKALRTPTSQLDSRTREALLELQQALKEQSAVLREAGFGAEAKEVELSRLQTFDPTNQRVNTIQQEMKKAQEDARKAKETAQHDQGVAQMFGQPFADRARGIRNIAEEATALGEEIIRDYGSSAANMAASQGKSLQQIAAARAAAENEARARTESTVSHSRALGIDDPLTLNASQGDTRMVKMARLMQESMALRLQQEKAVDPRMAELREQLDPETFANVQRRRRALQSGQLTPANRAIVEQRQREDLKGTKFGDGITTTQTHFGDAHRRGRLGTEEFTKALEAAIQANTAAVTAKNEADATMQQQQQEQQAAATNNVTANTNIQLAVSLDQALSELTPQLVAAVKNALITDLETKMPEAANALKAAAPQIQS